MWVPSLGWEGPLKKELATRTSILAWGIPWTEESGELQSMGLKRVRHDWIDYNTIRAIPYMGIYHPYIMFSYWDIDTDSIIGLDESGRIAYDYDDHDGEEIIPIPNWLVPCIVGKTHDEMLVFDKKMLEERVAVHHDDGDMVIGIVMTPLNTKE